MNREDIIRMAREAGYMEVDPSQDPIDLLTRFAALVAAAQRNLTWTQKHWTEYERSIVAAEREECAKLAEEIGDRDSDNHAYDAAAAIRNRRKE